MKVAPLGRDPGRDGMSVVRVHELPSDGRPDAGSRCGHVPSGCVGVYVLLRIGHSVKTPKAVSAGRSPLRDGPPGIPGPRLGSRLPAPCSVSAGQQPFRLPLGG